MINKVSGYKEAPKSVILQVFFFHLLYFLSLANTNIVRPQYVFLYLVCICIYNFRKIYINLEFFILFFIIFIWSVIALFARGWEVDYFINICYFFSLFIIIQFYSIYCIGTKLHWVIIICYFYFVIFNLLNGVDSNHILDTKSQNMVGFYMLCYVISFYIESYKENGSGKHNIIPAILNFLLALLMFGRASIVVAILLLFITVFVNFKNNKLIKNFIYVVVFFTFLSLIYLDFATKINQFVELSFSRFGKEGADLTGRSEIWSKYSYYFQNSIIYEFFGVSLNIDKTFIHFDKNMHNSYLTLHSYMGIGSLVMLYIVFKRFIVKNKFILKALLFILLMRSFSDSVLFFSFNDYVLFSMIFVIKPLNKISV